eukprot:TRINITY_DN28948_c0_g1_i1.p1 TRINITY_DN28948_c0_g1~~TRINITY_DN28948_c0_g1_i1.p1  ORF type:complete len:450 (+),score=77.56 TRINITY_DN28948_c0_g1_i1:154-1350(+)
MAASPEPQPREGEDWVFVNVGRELQCGICEQMLNDPLLLPCCNNAVCSSCFGEQILNAEDAQPPEAESAPAFECPRCKARLWSGVAIVDDELKEQVESCRREVHLVECAHCRWRGYGANALADGDHMKRCAQFRAFYPEWAPGQSHQEAAAAGGAWGGPYGGRGACGGAAGGPPGWWGAKGSPGGKGKGKGWFGPGKGGWAKGWGGGGGPAGGGRGVGGPWGGVGGPADAGVWWGSGRGSGWGGWGGWGSDGVVGGGGGWAAASGLAQEEVSAGAAAAAGPAQGHYWGAAARGTAPQGMEMHATHPAAAPAHLPQGVGMHAAATAPLPQHHHPAARGAVPLQGAASSPPSQGTAGSHPSQGTASSPAAGSHAQAGPSSGGRGSLTAWLVDGCLGPPPV